MTAKKALVIVVLWGVTFASIGGVIGAVLGTAAPDYYRVVFRDGHSPDVNPIQVGIGLGVTQGLALGVVTALVVLALLAWRDHRVGHARTTGDSAGHALRPRQWTRRALWGVATSLFVVVFGTVAFVLGGIVGQQQLYQSWTDRKLRKIDAILESREFPNVRAGYSSAAQVFLTGTVKDETARQSLHDQLIFAFGSDEADEILRQVDVGH